MEAEAKLRAWAWAMVYSVLIVFVVCTAIEFVRRKTVEKAYMPAVERLAGWIERKVNCIFDKLVKDAKFVGTVLL